METALGKGDAQLRDVFPLPEQTQLRVITVALSQGFRRVHFPSAFEEQTMKRLMSPGEEQMLGNQFGLVHTPAAKLTGWSTWR